jgi:hypothetical protein
MTSIQRQALAAAQEGRLLKFPRGWARDKSGPFYLDVTILALRDRGCLRIGSTGLRRFAAPAQRPRGV